eukprot:4122907-Amphidinium_carterae.1
MTAIPVCNGPGQSGICSGLHGLASPPNWGNTSSPLPLVVPVTSIHKSTQNLCSTHIHYQSKSEENNKW